MGTAGPGERGLVQSRATDTDDADLMGVDRYPHVCEKPAQGTAASVPFEVAPQLGGQFNKGSDEAVDTWGHSSWSIGDEPLSPGYVRPGSSPFSCPKTPPRARPSPSVEGRDGQAAQCDAPGGAHRR